MTIKLMGSGWYCKKTWKKKKCPERKQRLGPLGKIMFILYFRGFTVEFVIDLVSGVTLSTFAWI